jgi:AcrR family transcriptional regulator
MKTSFSTRQGEIIDAALSLIAEGGIQALTIKNLSRVVGISEPGLYRHFANKMEILHSIIEYSDSENRKVLLQIRESELQPLEQLEAFFQHLFGKFMAQPGLSVTLLLNEMFQKDKGLMKRLAQTMERTRSFLVEIIAEGQANKTIRSDLSPSSLSTVLIGTVRLEITRWRLTEFGFDLEQEGMNLWRDLKELIAP